MRDHSIYLLRHGQTESNVDGRYQGQMDSALTEKGLAQAHRHGRVLRDLLDDPSSYRFVASPLGRTMKTAEIVCGEIGYDAAQIETDERLKERCYGNWEGLNREQIIAAYPGEWAKRKADYWGHAMPGGESFVMVTERIKSWLDEAEGKMIVVSHGALGRALRGVYDDLTPQQIRLLGEPQDLFFHLENGVITEH